MSITWDEYRAFVKETCKYPRLAIETRYREDHPCKHVPDPHNQGCLVVDKVGASRVPVLALGLVGEAAEFMEAGVYRENQSAELGDILWYLMAIGNEMGWEWEDPQHLYEDAEKGWGPADDLLMESARFCEKLKKNIRNKRAVCDSVNVDTPLETHWHVCIQAWVEELNDASPLLIADLNMTKLRARMAAGTLLEREATK